MSSPGELLRDNKLPPHFEMRVLIGAARSMFVLAVNERYSDEFAKIVGLNLLSQDNRQVCSQLALRLHGSPFEDAELSGSGRSLTSFERRVAELLGLKEPVDVRERVSRTTVVLDKLGTSGNINSVDQVDISEGIMVLDAIANSLAEMYPAELPPMVSSHE